MTDVPTRRSVLRGFGLTAVAGVAGFVTARHSSAARRRPVTAAANAYGTKTAPHGRLLTTLDRVPAGGGVILGDVVLTRDAAGDVRAYSSTCTHQGCTVNAVKNGRISCPCHGSVFDARTGDVLSGPAPRPLVFVEVVVRDGGIYTG